jgi:polysaccharide deacetylase 2 family uncharacterized protein YibQ
MIAANAISNALQRPIAQAIAFVAGFWHNLDRRQQRIAGCALAVVVLILLILAAASPAPAPSSISISVAPSPQRVTVSMAPRPASKVSEPSSNPTATANLAPNMADLTSMLSAWQADEKAMPSAPIADLQVGTQDGLLPRIAPDGRAPWRAYARPVAPEGKSLPAGVPMIAVLVVDMGLSERLTLPAIEQLPGQVSVALSAFSPTLDQQISMARNTGPNGGREVFLDIPTEPTNYPAADPGPDALLTRLTGEQNISRLRPMLAKAQGVVGVTTQGDAFTSDGSAITPLFQELGLRGLAWVDAVPTPSGKTNTTQAVAATIGNPAINADIWVDTVLSPSVVKAQLASALQLAKQTGRALIIARPYPLTVTLLNNFFATLPAEGVALVPVTTMIERQAAQ